MRGMLSDRRSYRDGLKSQIDGLLIVRYIVQYLMHYR